MPSEARLAGCQLAQSPAVLTAPFRTTSIGPPPQQGWRTLRTLGVSSMESNGFFVSAPEEQRLKRRSICWKIRLGSPERRPLSLRTGMVCQFVVSERLCRRDLVLLYFLFIIVDNVLEVFKYLLEGILSFENNIEYVKYLQIKY